MAYTENKYDNNGNLIASQPTVWSPYQGAPSPCVDSIVTRTSSGELLFGQEARQNAGRKGSVTYKGYKMLLTERDPQKLAQRGYDEKYTPQYIMKCFLEYLLQEYIKNTPDLEYIDKLVVGVPEIWDNEPANRVALENILSEFPFVGEVELVSEPCAACAYFVDNYKKINQGKLFEGHLLLVDYGGGTLDIALCSVKQMETGNEVKVIRCAGAGENQEGMVGKAGMAFIETVVLLALKEVGMDPDAARKHRKFPTAVQGVENALMINVDKIARRFGDRELDDCCEIESQFTYFEFGDEEEVTVTYGMLAQAYRQVIAPVLDEKLDEIISYMNANGLDWRSSEKENFKVALAGGFCDFFLTQEQIKNKLEGSAGDHRFSGMVTAPGERQKAIAYGAALIADEVTCVRQTANFHLGIASGTKDNPGEFFFSIHKGDEITYGEPVFIHNDNGEELVFTGTSIPLLAFGLDESTEYISWGEPMAQYRSKLALAEGKFYKLGFSLDRSKRISLHKQIVESPARRDVVLDEACVKLGGNMYDVLGKITQVRRVSK